MNKQNWLDIAEVADALRLMPRLILAGCYIGFFCYVYWVTGMYFATPNPGVEITAFVTVIIPAITGIISAMTNKYFQTGRKWGGDNNSG